MKTNSSKCLGERSCSTSTDLKTVIKYVDVKAHRTICVGVQTNSDKTSVCMKEFITQVLMLRQTVTKQVFTLEVKPPLYLSDEKLGQSMLTNDQTVQSFLTNDQTVQSFLTNHQTVKSFLTNHQTVQSFLTNDQTVPSFLTNDQMVQSFLTNDQTVPSFLTNDQTVQSFLTNHQTVQSFLTNDQTVPPFLTNDQMVHSFLTNDQTVQSFLTRDQTASLFIPTNDQLAVYHELCLSSHDIFSLATGKQIKARVSMTPSREMDNNGRAVVSS